MEYVDAIEFDNWIKDFISENSTPLSKITRSSIARTIGVDNTAFYQFNRERNVHTRVKMEVVERCDKMFRDVYRWSSVTPKPIEAAKQMFGDNWYE